MKQDPRAEERNSDSRTFFVTNKSTPLVKQTLAKHVEHFVRLLSEGKSLQAMELFYSDEVNVFENRALVRAGKPQCLRFEREQLAFQPHPPSFRLKRRAIDAESECVFLEYILRFHSPTGRPQRLDEVAVQSWSGDKIIEERFYYEGLVDEGD